jgi:endonuclease-3 related protein
MIMQRVRRQDASAGEAMLRYYEALFARLGPQRWWPAKTRLEVILGAILTQNTNWNNASIALRRLRRAGLLKFAELRRVSNTELEACIRSAGFYHQKVRTIKTFLELVAFSASGSLARFFNQPTVDLRRKLLGVPGLGPETADAILLYAAHQPYFVADAYTRRILSRHGLISPQAGYAETQDFIHQHLPRDERLYNEFHALLVGIGKQHCRRNAALCPGCPLQEFLPQEEAWYRGKATAAGSLQPDTPPA